MKERNARVTSEARARPRAEDDAETVGVVDPRAESTAEEPSVDDAPAGAAEQTAAIDATGEDTGRTGRVSLRKNRTAEDDEDEDRAPRAARLSVPVVPVLAGLLVLLLAGTAFLWFTRPDPSSVRTADYVQVLEAARSGVVDLTSFDYLTLDDDIAQVKKIAIGDLQKESVDQLNGKRKDLTDSQAIVNTQVVGAAVTRADDTHGTAVLVIQSTQQTKASTQPTVVRYRIEVELQKVSGRWRLSGISGR
jgi:Mce-associated membrane protein